MLKDCLSPSDPKNPWKMKVLNPQYMGEITPKNEGCGFPWKIVSQAFKTLWNRVRCYVSEKPSGPQGDKEHGCRMDGHTGCQATGQREGNEAYLHHGNPQPSFLGVISYNPYIWGF